MDLASLLSSGYWALSPGLKRPGCEADHSLPSSAEVKKKWSYTSTTPYIFMAWYVISIRDNFAFYFFSIKTPNGGISSLEVVLRL
jgi:hypothetical protein